MASKKVRAVYVTAHWGDWGYLGAYVPADYTFRDLCEVLRIIAERKADEDYQLVIKLREDMERFPESDQARQTEIKKKLSRMSADDLLNLRLADDVGRWDTIEVRFGKFTLAITNLSISRWGHYQTQVYPIVRSVRPTAGMSLYEKLSKDSSYPSPLQKDDLALLNETLKNKYNSAFVKSDELVDYWEGLYTANKLIRK